MKAGSDSRYVSPNGLRKTSEPGIEKEMNQALATAITQHELSEIRAFIEARSGIVFDDSRTRFFSGRVQEHMEHKSVRHGMELLRMIRNSNSEYDQLLERVLTQETSFFRYPGIFNALGNIVLP